MKLRPSVPPSSLSLSGTTASATSRARATRASLAEPRALDAMYERIERERGGAISAAEAAISAAEVGKAGGKAAGKVGGKAAGRAEGLERVLEGAEHSPTCVGCMHPCL